MGHGHETKLRSTIDYYYKVFVMFQVQISRSVHLTVFITVLAIALGVEKCCCAGSLVTTPPAIGGVLTSCGETQLTCSHDNVAGENTRWRIGSAMDSSLVCQETIDHTSPASPYSCSEFNFEDITAFSEAGSCLNSTAMVNPLPMDLSGFQMECIAGALSTSPSVGCGTLCIIGEYTT
jgi:hypothetical protein